MGDRIKNRVSNGEDRAPGACDESDETLDLTTELEDLDEDDIEEDEDQEEELAFRTWRELFGREFD
jgi:hypothetical protein